MEAKDYHFTGITLNHSVSVEGQKIRGILFFSSIKNYGSNTSNQNIEGVEVFVAGHAYVIADGKIWLQASQINADAVTMKAKQIELEALVGTNFHNMWIKKHSLRLAFTCGKGELSAGIESKYTYTNTTVVEQHLAPSAIIGRSRVDIEADELNQISSAIQGSKGKIKAKKWIAKAIELIRSVESDTVEVSVGLKLGVQENISGTTKTIKYTISNLDKGGDFAGINTISNIYSSVRGVMALAGGNIISPCPWVSASASASHYERSDTTYAISEAMFDELYVESDSIEGALNIQAEADIKAESMNLTKPEGKTHEEMSFTGVSVSNTGFSANHYQEENGRGFGFGISGSWDRKNQLFGDTYNFKYKNGEHFLDVSYAHPNHEKLSEVDLSLKNLPSRCIDNVNQTLRSVFETVGLKYKPLIFDTIQSESKEELNQDDPNISEQDLDPFDQLADEIDTAFSEEIPDSSAIDKERVTSALILIKANELGYNATDIQNDEVLEHASDLVKIDLSIAEWKKVSDQNTGIKKVFADNMVASLNGVRDDIANGNKSFESYWAETKHNLESGKTSWSGAVPDGVGNLVSYVEGKIGNVISNNLPKVKASVYATLGTGFAYALEGARKLFGDENVAAVINKMKDCKECIDEHSTSGQRKVAEYILGFTAGALINKTYYAIKGKGKLPHIPDEFIGSAKSKIFTSTEKIAEILNPLNKKGQKFFDTGISAIEEAVFNKTKFNELPSDVKKYFAGIIQVDKNGVVEGIAHMQSHHILPKAVSEFEDLLTLGGMNINDKVNLTHLPDGVAKGLYPTARMIHSGKHNSKEYIDPLLKKAKELTTLGTAESWSQEQYKNKIIELIGQTRQGLENGTIKLNNAKPLLEKVKDGSIKR
ncbi:hypothetical protein phytr_10540 [Candidatus Phycorickettsia trachydisci]|uniref:Uncharacterized protein n=1 Tax=Candidatus Phycorickettsia trachydisci TaxID=2115978 RepID=A0A2P1P9N0_9RICK|nr:AHH domain-containing protein [Candidatus Phycorickettsia trachydisci]AVP87982.1 hypothetical protein phytr_10540 [Candidatus Phycorickettsia trachydisci]